MDTIYWLHIHVSCESIPFNKESDRSKYIKQLLKECPGIEYATNEVYN